MRGELGLAFVGAAFFQTGDAPALALAPAVVEIAPPPVLPTPIEVAASAATPEAKHRQLTVMFCDMVGSTALSTGMAAVDLRDVIASGWTATVLGRCNICCWRCRPMHNWRSAIPKQRLKRSLPD
jgi:hypothetical protein